MQQEEKSKKRTSIGKISGIVGIFCNCILAGSKIIIGNFAGSMSIAADGLNNLSDAASSIVTLIGFKIAEKPADKVHPYGHARSEYLASLTVAVMILFIGFELAKSSVEKILHPSPVEFSGAVLCVMGLCCRSQPLRGYSQTFSLISGPTLPARAKRESIPS